MNEIRDALDTLLERPEDEASWKALSAISPGDSEGLRALAATRFAFARRRELSAVVRLLDLEAKLTETNEVKAKLLRESVRILRDELLEPARARDALTELAIVTPNEGDVQESIEAIDAHRERWSEIIAQGDKEIEGASGPFKASMLTRGAEIAFGYGLPALAAQKRAKKKYNELEKDIAARIEQALAIEPANTRALRLKLRLVEKTGDVKDQLLALEQMHATQGVAIEDRIGALFSLMRLNRTVVGDNEAAIGNARALLEIAPRSREAVNLIVKLLREKKDFEGIAEVLEKQLKSGLDRADEMETLYSLAVTFWKERGDLGRAENYFLKLRASDPTHKGMLAFFRDRRKDSPKKLLEILRGARSAGDASEELDREIEVLEKKEAEVLRTMQQWQDVLAKEPTHPIAREQLRRLYRTLGDDNALLRLLQEDYARATTPIEQLKLLRELAAMEREFRGGTSSGTLAAMCELSPDDLGLWHELGKAYAREGKFRALASVEVMIASRTDDPHQKKEGLRSAARHLAKEATDVEATAPLWERVLAIDPEDREALLALRAAYERSRSFLQLAQVLASLTARATGEDKAALLFEHARLADDRLQDALAASALYQSVLEILPAFVPALTRLEALALRTGDEARLRFVLERRLALAEQGDARVEALVRLARLLSERFRDHEAARPLWEEVSQLRPGHPLATAALREAVILRGDIGKLLRWAEASGDWAGLIEALRRVKEETDNPDKRFEASLRAGITLAERFNSHKDAIAEFDDAAAIYPHNREVIERLIAALDAMGERGRIPELLERLYALLTDTVDKSAVLGRLSELARTLGDAELEWRTRVRAFEVSPETDYEGLLDTARALGREDAFADALEGAIDRGDVKNAEAKIELARIRARKEEGVKTAIRLYRELLAKGETSVTEEAEALFRADKNADALRELYERRVSQSNTAQKINFLSEWGELEEKALVDLKAAARCYRAVLELVPHHGRAARSLARVLIELGEYSEAEGVLLRDRNEREGDERAEREVELARFYLTRLQKPQAALAASERALEVASEGSKVMVLSVLEELLDVPETRPKAATLLENVYGDIGGAERQAEMLEVLLATAKSKVDRKDIYARLIDVEASRGGDKSAYAVAIRAAREIPQELSFWDRLALFSKRTGHMNEFLEALTTALPPTGPSQLPREVEIDLAERIATLYDDSIGQQEKSEPYYGRLLALDPGNERIFTKRKQLLSALARWDELEQLYLQVLPYVSDRERVRDLLSEAALVAEEMREDKEAAVRLLEELIRREPDDDSSRRSLARLYERLERWEPLARLIDEDVQKGRADDEDRLRLAGILVERLRRPKDALPLLERALDGSDLEEAIRLLRRTLDASDRQSALRASELLEEPLLSEPKQLVVVLERRYDLVNTDAERIEIASRIATLRDEELRDGSFDAYRRLVTVAPGRADARARFIELGTAENRLVEVATTLGQAAAQETEADVMAAAYLDAASVWIQAGRPNEAEAALSEVRGRGSVSVELQRAALSKLADVFRDGRRWEQLEHLLDELAPLSDAGEERLGVFVDLAEVRDLRGAPAEAQKKAWEAVLDESPEHLVALKRLDRLYAGSSQPDKRAHVLRALKGVVFEPQERKVIGEALVRVLHDELDDEVGAREAIRELMTDFGPDRTYLEELIPMVRKAGEFAELRQLLEDRIELFRGSADQANAYYELGALEVDLNEFDDAIDRFRAALTLDSNNRGSREKLEELLAIPDARLNAARALRPLYEADGDSGRLIRVLETLLIDEESKGERLELLTAATKLAEANNDPQRAYALAFTRMNESIDETNFLDTFDEALDIARTAEKEKELLASGAEIRANVEEGIRRDYLHRLAMLAMEVEGLSASEIYLTEALDLKDDDEAALGRLEVLYAEEKNWEKLYEVLGRHESIAPEIGDQAALLLRRAEIAERSLNDANGAIVHYEEVLERQPDPRAFVELRRLYRSNERYGDLMTLMERQATESINPGTQAKVREEMGLLASKELADVDRAFSEFETALDLVPSHPGTLDRLEELLVSEEAGERAQAMLEVEVGKLGDRERLLRILETRARVQADVGDRHALLIRAKDVAEQDLRDPARAFEIARGLLEGAIPDEALLAEVVRLAEAVPREHTLAEDLEKHFGGEASEVPEALHVIREAAHLFEKTGDLEKAAIHYRRAFRIAKEDELESFRSADRLFARLDRDKDRAELLEARIQATSDDEERLELLSTLATVVLRLGDKDAAIAAHRRALEIRPGHETSFIALADLLRSAKDVDGLTDFLRAQVEFRDGERRGDLHLELAQLAETKKESLAAAEDYGAVLDLVAHDHRQAEFAILGLERLIEDVASRARTIELLKEVYEPRVDRASLIRLAQAELTLVEDAAERAPIELRIAGLHEALQHYEEAFGSMSRAYLGDPSDGEARAEFVRLAELADTWDLAVATLETGLARLEGSDADETLVEIAKIHDKRRDDPRRALDAWLRLSERNPADVAALDEVEQLATLLSDWHALVKVYEKRLTLSTDEETSASLFRRIGEAKRDMLEDRAGALLAYESSLELEGDNRLTLDSLLDLYGTKAREKLEDSPDAARRFVALAKKRVELLDEEETATKVALLFEAGELLLDVADARDDSLELFREVRALDGSRTDVRTRILDALEKDERFEELDEELAKEITEGAPPLEGVRTRRADLLANKLEKPLEAFPIYAEVLAQHFDEPTFAKTLVLARNVAEERDAWLTELERIARSHEHTEKVVDVLRLSAEFAEGDAQKLERVLRVAAALRDLKRSEEALTTVLPLLDASPEDAALNATIDVLLEDLGNKGWQVYGPALDRVAKTSSLRQRHAELAETFGDLAAARTSYEALVELDQDHARTFYSLERTLLALGDHEARARLHRRWADETSDATEKSELLRKLASIQAEELQSHEAAFSSLEEALEVVDSSDNRAAYVALLEKETEVELFRNGLGKIEPRLLAADEAWTAVRLLERSFELDESTKLPVAKRLANLNRTTDIRAAQKWTERVVGLDPTNDAEVEELEKLAGETNEWATAVDTTEATLASLEGAAKTRRAERLALWMRDHLYDVTRAEHTFELASGSETALDALITLRRGEDRRGDLVATLLRRSEIAGTDKLRFLEEALDVALVHGDETAEPIARKILENGEHANARKKLAEILERTNRPGDAATEHLALAKMPGQNAFAHTMKAATLFEQISETERARNLYFGLLAAHATDADLRRRLLAIIPHADERRVAVLDAIEAHEEGREERRAARYELSELHREANDLNKAAAAIERELAEPGYEGDAFARLDALYRAASRWTDLAALLRQERAYRNDAYEGERITAVLRELAEVEERSLEDLPAALATYRALHERTHDAATLEKIADLAERTNTLDVAVGALRDLSQSAQDDQAFEFARRWAKASRTLGNASEEDEALRRALGLRPEAHEVDDELIALLEKSESWGALAAHYEERAELLVARGGLVPPPEVRGSIVPPPGGSLAPKPSGLFSRTSISPGQSVGAPVLAPDIARVVENWKKAAVIHRRLGEPTSAARALDRAVTFSPSNRELLQTRVEAYEAAGMIAEALEGIEKIAAIFAGKRSKELAVVLRHKARLLTLSGQKPLALEELDRAFKIDPSSVPTLRDLGLLALELTDYDRAQKTFRALLLQKLEDSGITKAEVFFYLGEVSKAQGDKPKAKQMYERALESDSSLERAQTALSQL